MQNFPDILTLPKIVFRLFMYKRVGTLFHRLSNGTFIHGGKMWLAYLYQKMFSKAHANDLGNQM